jgi:DNA-binding beta-propeller fold protein YncE
MAKLTGPASAAAPGDSLKRSPATVGARAPIGQVAYSEDGRFVYVTASGAITASGDAVSMTTDLLSVVRGSTSAGAFIGCSEAPMASGDSGYIRTQGPCSMVVDSGAVAGDVLELSSNTGKLSKYVAASVKRPVGVALAASDNAGVAAINVYLF